MSKKRKKLKELTDADIAACEPESIWLETRKCPVPAHSVLWVLVLLLVLGVVWACVSKVDKVVAAEGKLVTTRPNITMKPLERTVIKSVPVRVGQVVEKDQVLVELDPTVNQAELRSLSDQLAHYRCQAARLRAEQMQAAEQFFQFLRGNIIHAVKTAVRPFHRAVEVQLRHRLAQEHGRHGEVAPGGLFLGHAEHLRGHVRADELMAPLGHQQRQRARAAAKVKEGQMFLPLPVQQCFIFIGKGLVWYVPGQRVVPVGQSSVSAHFRRSMPRRSKTTA